MASVLMFLACSSDDADTVPIKNQGDSLHVVTKGSVCSGNELSYIEDILAELVRTGLFKVLADETGAMCT